jgi:hypothetical protein
MGLRREYSLKVSYITETADSLKVDIFYDGKPAHEVTDLASLPQNARAVSLKPVIQVFGAACLASLIIYLLARVIQAKRTLLKNTILVTPIWRAFKNEVVLHVASTPGVILRSFSDGDFHAAEPEAFWHALVEANDQTIGLDVRVKGQSWPEMQSKGPDQHDFALKLHFMALKTPNLSHVALIFDTEMWNEGVSADLATILLQLANAAGRPKYLFLHGTAEEVCSDLLNRIAEQPLSEQIIKS